MIEILGGEGLENMFKHFDIDAKCTYRHVKKSKYDYPYEVWELSDEQFEFLDKICTSITQAEWDTNDWGWWRYSDGSNLGKVNAKYMIRDQEIMAWDGERRRMWPELCNSCSDLKDKLCHGAKIDFDDCCGSREYSDVMTYVIDELRMTTVSNICSVLVDLANQNQLTLSELFEKYMG